MTITLTTPAWVSSVLDRKPHDPTISVSDFADERILITGGLGSIGLALFDAFEAVGLEVVNSDIDEIDVTDATQVASALSILKPSMIFHLAGAKHAPEGEVDPMECVRVNTLGTMNVLEHAPAGSRVVTASTCKACDPETSYGASKLLAERLTLNAGHSVARFHNVVETSGNVFEIWRKIRPDEPLGVVRACERYFISAAEAVGLLLHAATNERAGRFTTQPGRPQSMWELAGRAFPNRKRELLIPRRGDRLREPLHAQAEVIVRVDTSGPYVRIVGSHDAEAVIA